MADEWEWINDGRVDPVYGVQNDTAISLIPRNESLRSDPSQSRTTPFFHAYSHHVSYTKQSYLRTTSNVMNEFSEEELAESRRDRQRYLLMANAIVGMSLPKNPYKDHTPPTDDSTQKGCGVDHGKTRYARVHNKATSKSGELPVREDTGSPCSWIHPYLASEFEMDIEDDPNPQQFRDFGNTPWTAKQYVEINLLGRSSKSIRQILYLTPETCPVQGIIVGSEFISTWGHPNELFMDEPQRSEMLVLVQDSYTESEQNAIKQRRAEIDRKRSEFSERAKRSNAPVKILEPDLNLERMVKADGLVSEH